MVCGWFFQSHLFPLLIALLGLSVLTTLLTSRLLTETMAEPVHTDRNIGLGAVFNSYRTVMFDQRFLLFTLGGIALMFIEYQRNNYVSVRLAEELKNVGFNLGIFGTLTLDGVKVLSLLTAVNTIMVVLFTAPVASWVTTRRQRPIMYIGFLIFTLGYAVTAFSNHLLILFAATVVFTFGELLYVPTRQTVLAEIIDEEHRGSYVAFNGIIYQVGKILASLSLMLSPLIGKYGMGLLMVLAGLLALLLTKAGLSANSHRIDSPSKQPTTNQE